MKNITNYFLLFLLLCGSAANGQQVEMADGLRSEGKIYVVVVIIMIILIGLFLYLFMMDRKLSRMEKMIQENRKLNKN